MRLHLQAGPSYNEISGALKISKSVVGKYVSLARVAGVDWDIAQGLSDEDLEVRLYRRRCPGAATSWRLCGKTWIVDRLPAFSSQTQWSRSSLHCRRL